ncbi:MAG: hypothetical protein E7169_03710 [Firmicutes bacterium]|nr:hypothetical protein [Bacillota bacterium]
MDKRNKTKNVLIIILFTTIIISLIITNVYFIKLSNDAIKNSNELKNKLEKNEEKLDKLNNEINNTNELITLYKNIDTKINEAKQEYYKTLKEFENKVLSGEVNYKIAYLTFDDGPYYLTHSFLKVLEENDVRATFFTIGYDKDYCYDNRSMYCGDMYKKIYNLGHTLANHTYTHHIHNGIYNSSDAFINDVKKQEQLIKDRTGFTTNIVRFPGGSAQAKGLKNDIVNKLKQNGYGWVDWTSLNGDGATVSNTYDAMNNFKNTIGDKVEVVLFHDYSYITLSILPDAIKYLKDNNYVLLPLFYESKMVNK